MKMIKTFNPILACGLLLMSIGLAFGQTPDERKLELTIQTGHVSWVASVRFSPDGKLLASGGLDFAIKLWNAESNQEIKSLKGHVGWVQSVAFSPDGKILASGGEDKIIKLWNIESGHEIKFLRGHEGSVQSVAFSPDEKTLVSGSYDNTVRLWNIETGHEIKLLREHTDKVNSVAFSPDGKILASGSLDCTIRLWDVKTGQQIKSLTGHIWGVSSVAFSPDGKTLASGSWDKTIRLWNVETGQQVKFLKGHNDYVYSVAFSPDGKTLASGSWDNTIKLWNVETGKHLISSRGNSDKVFSVAFSPDGKTLASGTYSAIGLWDVNSGKQVKSLVGHAWGTVSVAFSPDAKFLAVGTVDNTIKIWNLETGQLVKFLAGHTSAVTSVTFSPDGKTLASGSSDRTIKLWNVETGREMKSLGVFASFVTSLSFSPDGNTLISGTFDVNNGGKPIPSNSSNNTLKLWNVESGQEIKSLTGVSSFTTVAYSKDGKMIASGNGDNTITIWNADTGQIIKNLTGHTKTVWSVVFSPDGKTLASGSDDETIKLWSVGSGQEIKSLTGHNAPVLSTIFSPDGETVGSGSRDNTIKLWNVQNGKQIKTFTGHSREVLSIAFSSTGKTLASGSGDNTIKLWNVEQDAKLVSKDNNKPLATLINLNENDWAVITTDRRFDASEGALKLMQYTYGLEVINLDQLKEVYYEPGLLGKILGYSKEPLRPIVPLADVKLYPEILEKNFDSKTGKLNLKLKSRGGGIGKTEVFVNGKRVVEDARDEKLKQNPNVPIDTVVSLTVDVPPSAFVKGVENQIKIITSNYLKEIGKGNIQSRGVELVHLDTGNAELELPTLYAIVGGVSDYTGDALDLRFAAKDAEDFSNALRLGANRLFCPSNKAECLGKINITTLSTARQNADEQPTKENFKKAFADIAAKAKPEDIFLVYLAGHGVTLGAGTDTYFYLTKDARAAGKTDLEKNFQTVAISSAELTDWLTPNADNPNDIFVKALKQVIILDTCAAGNFAREDWKKDRDLSGDQIRAMEFLKDKTGTFILMGSASNAVSYEANRYNQGLLTYALLEGIKGFALQKATNNVDVRLLFDYAEKRVPDLAKDMNLDQRPIIKQPSGNTFLIGQMTDAEKTKINLPQPKPLLLRPLLTNPETGDDDLKLIPELRKRFDAESSYEVMQRSGKGEPALIYIDDDSFPSAVRVTGTYTVEGETVRLKAFLRKDGKTIATLPEIVGKKEELVEKLLVVIRLELGKLN